MSLTVVVVVVTVVVEGRSRVVVVVCVTREGRDEEQGVLAAVWGTGGQVIPGFQRGSGGF